jgi:hypothetical protein
MFITLCMVVFCMLLFNCVNYVFSFLCLWILIVGRFYPFIQVSPTSRYIYIYMYIYPACHMLCLSRPPSLDHCSCIWREVLHHCTFRFYVLRKAWRWLLEVETCSLTQDNVFSLIVLDGLPKHTDGYFNSQLRRVELWHSCYVVSVKDEWINTNHWWNDTRKCRKCW